MVVFIFIDLTTASHLCLQYHIYGPKVAIETYVKL